MAESQDVLFVAELPAGWTGRAVAVVDLVSSDSDSTLFDGEVEDWPIKARWQSVDPSEHCGCQYCSWDGVQDFRVKNDGVVEDEQIERASKRQRSRRQCRGELSVHHGEDGDARRPEAKDSTCDVCPSRTSVTADSSISMDEEDDEEIRLRLDEDDEEDDEELDEQSRARLLECGHDCWEDYLSEGYREAGRSTERSQDSVIFVDDFKFA